MLSALEDVGCISPPSVALLSAVNEEIKERVYSNCSVSVWITAVKIINLRRIQKLTKVCTLYQYMLLYFLFPERRKKIFYMDIQTHLVITRSSGGIFWDRGISEARYRFCRQVFFFFF